MMIIKILTGIIAAFLIFNSHFIYRILKSDKNDISPSEKFWYWGFIITSAIFAAGFIALSIWA